MSERRLRAIAVAGSSTLLLALISVAWNVGPSAEATEGQEYGGLGPAASQELFEESFAPTVGDLERSAEPFARSADVVRFEDDFTAIVGEAVDEPFALPDPGDVDLDSAGEATAIDDDATQHSVVVSDLPLRARTDAGRFRPADLTLEETGAGFETENANVDVALAPSAEEGLELGGTDITVSVPNAEDEGSSLVEDVGVFYPEIAEDKDFFAAAVPGGVEVFTQIRSQEAANETVFEIRADGDSRLESSDVDGALLVGEDGDPLASIPRPTAIDASGAEVPVEMEIVSDSRLSLRVEVEDLAEAQLPVLVDPLIETYDWVNGGSGMLQWAQDRPNQEKWRTDYISNTANCWGGGAHCPGKGLYIYAKKGYEFAAGARGGFVYKVPRYGENVSTYSHQAEFLPVKFWLNGDPNPQPHLRVGIFRGGAAPLSICGEASKETKLENFTAGGLTVYNNASCTAAGNPLTGDTQGKEVRFELLSSTTRTTAQLHEGYLGGARIWLADGEAPGISMDQSGGQLGNWYKGTGTPGGNFITATDILAGSGASGGGMGIKSYGYQLYQPAGAAVGGPRHHRLRRLVRQCLSANPDPRGCSADRWTSRGDQLARAVDRRLCRPQRGWLLRHTHRSERADAVVVGAAQRRAGGWGSADRHRR